MKLKCKHCGNEDNFEEEKVVRWKIDNERNREIKIFEATSFRCGYCDSLIGKKSDEED